MPADSDKNRLPFEPNSKRKKGQKDKATPVTETNSKAVTESRSPQKAPSRSAKKSSREETSIPEAVSRRMLRRMFYFSGIPVILGVFIFFASYVLIIQDIVELPNVVVLLTTLACFGLSVIGLSYGVLSASWEEDAAGTLIGFDEFQVNFGRLVDSWRQAREERRQKS